MTNSTSKNCPTGKSLLIFRNRVKPPLQKYFPSHLTQISSLIHAVPSLRGACARYGRGAGCGGRCGACDERCRRGRPSRVVLTPQSLASSLREEAQATVSNKRGHRGEREVSRKPLRGECRVISGVTVVTNSCVCFFTHEAAGALGARHSLRPLISSRRETFLQTSGASRRGIAEAYLD